MKAGVLFFAAAAILLSLQGVFAENADERKNSDVVLPKVVFEIEGLPPEDFAPVLPARSDPELFLPPPDAKITEGPPVPESMLRPAAADSAGIAAPAEESSFFTQGTLGAGSMNGIVGGLSVIKTGGDFRFKTLFSHDGADGYDFHDPGTGFFRREDRVEGGTEIKTAAGGLSVDAGFLETEEGLQGLSADVYSAVHRFARADAAFSFSPAEDFTLRFGGGGAYAGKLLSSPDPDALPFDREGEEYGAGADAKLGWAADRHGLALLAKYGLRAAPGVEDLLLHRFNAALSGEYLPREGWRADASAGIYWSGGDPDFPFSAGIEGGLGGIAGFSFRAGRRVEELNYRDLWKELGLLRLQEDLDDGGTWFAGLVLELKNSGDRFKVKGGFEFLCREDAVVLEDFDPAISDFPFHQTDLLSFVVSTELRWRLAYGFSLVGEGKSIFGDRAFLEAAHRFEPGLEFLSESGRYAFSLSAGWNSRDETALPELRLEGSVKPAEGLEFSLSAEDVLAPLLDGGRPATGPFIAPGFRVMIKTTVSF